MPIAPNVFLIILPVVIAVVVLMVVTATDQRQKMFGRQGVAWFVTSLMIVAAIGIGYGKAHASVNPEAAPQPYVQDDAGVLSGSTLTQLTQRNQRLYDKYGVVIGVVTCNYGRDDLYDYALKRAEELDLRDYDMLVVLDIKGRTYGMIQGAALVNDFTDDDCDRYAWDYREDYFAVGLYDEAVLGLTEALEDWYGNFFN